MQRDPSTSRRLALLLSLLLGVTACTPTPTAAPFVPPAAPALPSPTAEATATASTLPATPIPASPTAVPSELPAPTTEACTNDLSFVQDITVPDGSVIQPGGTIEKQWLVTNSGTCDWDGSYRLKLVGGEALGAASEQALYPARAGAQATLQIIFTAPLLPGTYQSAWQAFAPDGSAFGQSVFLQFLVGSP